MGARKSLLGPLSHVKLVLFLSLGLKSIALSPTSLDMKNSLHFEI